MLLENPLPISYLFKDLHYAVVFVIVVSVVSNAGHHFFPQYFPDIPITIAAFVGTAISILLSFKMNQSYDRWWEARKIWGSIASESRTLVIQLQSFLNDEEQKPFIKRLAYRQICWCFVCSRMLRDQEVESVLDMYLNEPDKQKLTHQKNKAVGIIQLSALDLAKLKTDNNLDLYAQVQLDNTFIRLSELMGRAERIKSTVFPKRYRLVLQGAIYLFIVLLSLALQINSYVYEAIIVGLISFVFLFLETSATHLKDPFRNQPTDTPMTFISMTTEFTLRQLLGEKNVNPVPKENKYYLL